MYKLLFLIVLSFNALFTFAQTPNRTLSCYVVRISDGDTLTCALKNSKKLTVRLVGIDAPEKAQPFGNKSRQLLVNLAHKRDVVLEIQGYDRYKRVLATVYNKENQNVNLIMVKKGMAWAYQRNKKNSPYWMAEQQARRKRIGLWKDPNPILPADWRKAHRPTHYK